MAHPPSSRVGNVTLFSKVEGDLPLEVIEQLTVLMMAIGSMLGAMPGLTAIRCRSRLT